MGPIFWLADSMPANISTQYPLWSQMDAVTKADAMRYLDSLVNETVRHGRAMDGGAESFNERSLYAIPSDERSLVLLLREGGEKKGDAQMTEREGRHKMNGTAALWATRCTLPPSSAPVLPDDPQAGRGTFACRSGTGAYDYEIPSATTAQHDYGAEGEATGGVRQCDWSQPVQTDLPDAPSRTCAGRLPPGHGVGLIGNQGGHGRDPLTFCTSQDGLAFGVHFTVEAGAPPRKWYGPPGFQYPNFAWCTNGCPGPEGVEIAGGVVDTIIFSYSVTKEDIVLTLAPLASLKADDEQIYIGKLPAETPVPVPAHAIAHNIRFRPKHTVKAGCDISKLNVTVAADGDLEIELCGDKYRFASRFSYPGMHLSKWNTFGSSASRVGSQHGWHVTMQKTGPSTFSITGHAAEYTVERQIKPATDGSPRLLVSDTFTNFLTTPLGLAFENEITSTAPSSTRPECQPTKWCTHYTSLLSPCIHIGGLRRETGKTFGDGFTAANLAWNPSIVVEGLAGTGGLGIVALDERFRQQLDMSEAANYSVRLDNKGFALSPKESYSYTWVIYPLSTRDAGSDGALRAGYWEFINKLRTDYVPRMTLQAAGGWLDYLRASAWNPPRLKQWMEARGLQHIIVDGAYSGSPWLGDRLPDPRYPDVLNTSSYFEFAKIACKNLQAVNPKVQCLAPFETAMSPDNPPNDTTVHWPDSISIQPDGHAAGYRWPCKNSQDTAPACVQYERTHEIQFLYYPELNNSYYSHTQQCFDNAFSISNFTSGYFDIFSYSGTGQPAPGEHGDHDRWTYDRCDGFSVDLFSENYTINRCKCDLQHVSAPARATLVKSILSRSQDSVVVANDMGVADEIRALPIHHFLEAIADYGYTTSHFSSAMVLGYSPGYKAGAVEIGKPGIWWSTWDGDADWFDDMKDKLRSGVVYFAYSPPPNVTQPSLFGRMFPITISEIYNGTIIGTERILTLHSGRFSFGDASATSAEGLCFNGKGVPQLPVAALPVSTDATVTVTVPPDGACAAWSS
jgi:hypothetical protein